jgi:hypothetical protein
VFCEFVREYSAVQAGANNQIVIHVFHPVILRQLNSQRLRKRL